MEYEVREDYHKPTKTEHLRQTALGARRLPSRPSRRLPEEEEKVTELLPNHLHSCSEAGHIIRVPELIVEKVVCSLLSTHVLSTR